MGKATRWLKGLLGMKKERKNNEVSSSFYNCKREKKIWSFWRKPAVCRGSNVVPINVDQVERDAMIKSDSEKEDSKRAIEAVTAPAPAAAVAVVDKLRTSQGRNWSAALQIQSVYRGHLARRALRALKGLVNFQALVRGFLVRKRTATALKVIQTLIKVQTEVRIQRAFRSLRNTDQHQPRSGPRKEPRPNRTLRQATKMTEIGTCTPRYRKCWRIPAAVLSECEKDSKSLGWLQPSLHCVDCCCSAAHPMHSNVHVASAKRGYGDCILSCRNYMATTASCNLKLRSPYCRS